MVIKTSLNTANKFIAANTYALYYNIFLSNHRGANTDLTVKSKAILVTGREGP
jgi:hypothetical protein